MRRRRQISKVEEIHIRALTLAKDLQRARENGKITPSNTKRGRAIAEALNKFHNWNLSGDAGVRELVNHARTIGLPICGDGNGYFYAVDSAEMIPTIADLKSRIAKISQALHGLEKTCRLTEQLEANLFKQGGTSGNRTTAGPTAHNEGVSPANQAAGEGAGQNSEGTPGLR